MAPGGTDGGSPPARRRSLPRRYLAAWAAACHLVLDLVLSAPYLTVLAIGVAGLPLALAGGAGLLLVVAVVPLGLVAAALERARLQAFTGVLVPPPARSPEGTSLIRRVYLDSRAWKALLHMLLVSLWGLVAGSVVLVATSVSLAVALLPAYQWLLPGDSASLPLSNELPQAALLPVALTAGAVLLLGVPLLSALLVRVDVALVRGLLGRSEAAQVAHLSRRVATLTETRERAVDSVELERRRIERDLHDGPQQRLVTIAMDLGMAQGRLESDPAGARQLLDQAHTSAKEAITEMRQVARGIHPPVLTDRGLDAALSALADRAPVPVRVDVTLPARPSPTTEAIAYFCVSEALTNVAKHARASQAWVHVAAGGPGPAGGPQSLVVTVGDNGAGGARVGAGTGLIGLADRVAAVDGTLTVSSPPGGPTHLTVTLPWVPAGRPANPYAPPGWPPPPVPPTTAAAPAAPTEPPEGPR